MSESRYNQDQKHQGKFTMDKYTHKFYTSSKYRIGVSCLDTSSWGRNSVLSSMGEWTSRRELYGLHQRTRSTEHRQYRVRFQAPRVLNTDPWAVRAWRICKSHQKERGERNRDQNPEHRGLSGYMKSFIKIRLIITCILFQTTELGPIAFGDRIPGNDPPTDLSPRLAGGVPGLKERSAGLGDWFWMLSRDSSDFKILWFPSVKVCSHIFHSDSA